MSATTLVRRPARVDLVGVRLAPGQAWQFGHGGRNVVLAPVAGGPVVLVVVDAFAQHRLGHDQHGVVHGVPEPAQAAMDLGTVFAVDQGHGYHPGPRVLAVEPGERLDGQRPPQRQVLEVAGRHGYEALQQIPDILRVEQPGALERLE